MRRLLLSVAALLACSAAQAGSESSGLRATWGSHRAVIGQSIWQANGFCPQLIRDASALTQAPAVLPLALALYASMAEHPASRFSVC